MNRGLRQLPAQWLLGFWERRPRGFEGARGKPSNIGGIELYALWKGLGKRPRDDREPGALFKGQTLSILVTHEALKDWAERILNWQKNTLSSECSLGFQTTLKAHTQECQKTKKQKF